MSSNTNIDTVTDQDDVIIRPWIKRGMYLVNCTALDHDDPDHVYNQILAQGKMPERYGYTHPLTEEFAEFSRADLIKEIVDLRKEITGWARADAMGMLEKRKY